MPNTIVEEAQTRKGGGRSSKEAAEVTAEASARSSNALEDLRKQAEMAYSSYVEAQRKMARAYKVTERAQVADYKEAEERANRTCDEAIGKAMVARAQSEHEAREVYEKAIENAAKAFEGAVEQALKVCRQTIEQQWQATNETADLMWDIFQGKALS